jgi:hypothetical protein
VGAQTAGSSNCFGAADLLLLVSFHIGADGFGLPLHTLGGHLQAQANCSRPCSKLDSEPTGASIRRTPGEQSLPSTSSSRSRGLWPWWQPEHT